MDCFFLRCKCKNEIHRFNCRKILFNNYSVRRFQRFFVIQNESGEEVFRVNCGGGHRSWDIAFSGNSNPKEISVCYVKDGSVLVEKTSKSCAGSPVTIKVIFGFNNNVLYVST